VIPGTSDASRSPEGVAEAALPSNDSFAAGLRGFGPLGILAIFLILVSGNVVLDNMVVLPIGALLVLLWAWRSRTPWREIGYVRPGSWIDALAGGLALGIAFKFLMKAIVMPLLGADPVNQSYHFLAGNRALLPAALLAMIVAGFAEETVFRGYMFERFDKLFGSGAGAKASIVLISSAWFALGHYNTQGLAGVEQGAITGLAFGTIFAFTGGIFLIMVAHAAFDLTALAMIYWNLESDVAHLVFG
jgi:CAAX protease family protein